MRLLRTRQLGALPAHAARGPPHARPSHGAYLASNLVAKGLAARPKTAARAAEALLLLVELDAAEAAVVRARARAHSRLTPRHARARRAPPAPPPAPSRPLTRRAPRRRRA